MTRFEDRPVAVALARPGALRERAVRKADEARRFDAFCALHDDEQASLCVTVKTDGQVIVYCRACSPVMGAGFYPALVEKLGLAPGDFAPTSRVRAVPSDAVIAKGQAALEKNAVLRYEIETLGLDLDALVKLGVGAGPGGTLRFLELDHRAEIVGVGDYVLAFHRDDERPKYDVRGTRGLVYDPSDAGDITVLVEGAISTAAAKTLGLKAAGLHSAGAWDGRWRRLFGDTVVIVPDADGPGRTGASNAAQSLTKAGREVRIVNLFPDREDGSDLADLIRELGATDAGRALAALVADTPVFQRRRPGRPADLRSAAERLIIEMLGAGPASWEHIKARGVDRGFSAGTMRRAREGLAGTIEPITRGKRTYWALLTPEPRTPHLSVVRKPLCASSASADKHGLVPVAQNSASEATGDALGSGHWLPEHEVAPGIMTIAGRRPHLPDDDAPHWWPPRTFTNPRGATAAAGSAVAAA